MDASSQFLSPESSRKLQGVLQQLTDFIARYEVIEKNLESRGEELELFLTNSETRIKETVESIKDALQHYEEVMSEMGAARFRINVENLLQQGEGHLQSLQTLGSKLIKEIEVESTEFNKNVQKMSQHFHEILNEIDLEEVKDTAEHIYHLLEELSVEAMKKINKTFQGFFWKNMVIIIFSFIVAVVLMGEYFNSEWPWESHSRASEERWVGGDILQSWNTMDPAVRKDLQDNVFTDKRS